MVHRLAERDVAPDAPPDHEDWRHALEAVPSNLQRLFVNAAQSFLFNQVLSERLRRGLSFDRPVAGDVVCFADGDAPEELYAPDTDRLQRSTRTELPSSPATASAVGRSSPPPHRHGDGPRRR